MSLYLGIDTSNYKTSVALFDAKTQRYRNESLLLAVPEGRLGLRQSDALFQHVVNLPNLFHRFKAEFGAAISGVGVSSRPRAVEGSYMPCFLAGLAAGEAIAKTHNTPCLHLSHQQGHIVSAAFSAGKLDWIGRRFYVWHLSGGTTELLLADRSAGCALQTEIVGGTTDIAAGQLIDRAGVMLSLSFPAGAQLEQIAEMDTNCGYQPKSTDGYFSLSGMENKIKAFYESGAQPGDVAAAAIQTVCNAIVRATEQRMKIEPLPVLFCGGVAANGYLRKRMEQAFPGQCWFASGELSGDNAVGAAIFSYYSQQKEQGML